MSYQSLMVDLKGKSILVVGGGKVAYRKVRTMLDKEAVITVIAPDISEELYALGDTVTILQREVNRTDIEGQFLIVAATSDEQVNRTIANSCRDHQLVNVADHTEVGNTVIPGTVKRGQLTISVSTIGASPKLAKRIKQHLAKEYDVSYEDYVDFLSHVRNLVKKLPVEREVKDELLEEVLEERFRTSTMERERLIEQLRQQC